MSLYTPGLGVRLSSGPETDVKAFYSTSYSTSIGNKPKVEPPPPENKPTGFTLNVTSSVTIGNPKLKEGAEREWTTESAVVGAPTDAGTFEAVAKSGYTGGVTLHIGRNVTTPPGGPPLQSLLPGEIAKARRRDPVLFENEGKGPSTYSTTHGASYGSSALTLSGQSPAAAAAAARLKQVGSPMKGAGSVNSGYMANTTQVSAVVGTEVGDDDPALRQRQGQDLSDMSAETEQPFKYQPTGYSTHATGVTPWKQDDPAQEAEFLASISPRTADRTKRKDPAYYDGLVNPSRFATTLQTVGRHDTANTIEVEAEATAAAQAVMARKGKASGWGTNEASLPPPSAIPDDPERWKTTKEEELKDPSASGAEVSLPGSAGSASAFANSGASSVAGLLRGKVTDDQEELASMHPSVAAMQTRKEPVLYSTDPLISRTHDHKKRL